MEIRPIFSALMRNKTGAVLVALQIALSMAILSNALHIVETRQAQAARPSGLADEASTFTINVRNLALQGHQAQMATQKREAAVLRSVAGALSVANTSQTPLSYSASSSAVRAERHQPHQSAEVSFYTTPDSLIATWGLVLAEGRDFVPGDVSEIDQSGGTPEFPKVLIVTRATAAQVWPGVASVIGKTLYFGHGEQAAAARVVGVVERLQSPQAQIGNQAELSVMVPIRISGNPANLYAVRTEAGQVQRVIREAEQALRKSAPHALLLDTLVVSEGRAGRYRSDHALAWMLVAVSVLLLLVTASGIVGMASLWVTQRRKQIGVRRALGARRVDILRLFLTENMLITSGGVAAGVLLSIGLNQLLVSNLDMSALPLAYLVSGAAIFYVLGVLAVYGPAWRAASISPATATRSI